jgi:glucose-6-phosphate 1-epimerase
MAELDRLDREFNVPGVIKIGPGHGSLPKITITGQLGSADIYLHGAHVTHFQPVGAEPVLFMSGQSAFESGKPIRGGIPIVFPWFGPGIGPPRTPPHGFARLKQWDIESCDVRNDGSVRVVLSLESDDETLRQWPFAFVMRYIVIVSDSLSATLEVKNISGKPMEFEEALHTYLNVADVRKIMVNGLDATEYSDRTAAGAIKKQVESPINIIGETDRAYLHTQSSCSVQDSVMGRTITIDKEGSDVTVLWNPWIAKAKAMADFGDDEWPSMICLETANALDCAVKLADGATHRMSARISLSS